MAQILYSDRQIGLIREACTVVAECLRIAWRLSVPGGTTRQINDAIAAHIAARGCTSPFLGYQLPGKIPFPATVCTSVNDMVVHGLPDDRPLQEGELVSIDCGVRKGGYIGDAAWTFAIGQVSDATCRLMRTGREALRAGVAAARPKGKVGAISHAIQTLVEDRGYTVVREYVGHGVGQSLHEEPEVPNFLKPGAMLPFIGATLKPGTVIAIEPMVNQGKADVVCERGTWPVRTADGGLSVHFEHTIAILADRVEVLTPWEEPAP